MLLNVEDILGYAQLKAGKFRKDLKKFNICRAIEEIISIQKYQAESKNIEIKTKFIGFPPKSQFAEKYPYFSKTIPRDCQYLIIESDEKRIKQVLINLQSNALKFTRDGGSIEIVCEFIRGIYKKEQ